MDPSTEASVQPANANITEVASTPSMNETDKQNRKQVHPGAVDVEAPVAANTPTQQQMSTKVSAAAILPDIDTCSGKSKNKNKSTHRALRFLATRPTTLNGGIAAEETLLAIGSSSSSIRNDYLDESARPTETICETAGAPTSGLDFDNTGRLRLAKGKLPPGADHPGAYTGAPGNSYRLTSPAPAQFNAFSVGNNATIDHGCNYRETVEFPMDTEEINEQVPIDRRWQNNGNNSEPGDLEEAELNTVVAVSPQPQPLFGDEHQDEERVIRISDRADSRPLLEATLVLEESANPISAPQLAEVVDLPTEPKTPLCPTAVKRLCFGIAALVAVAGVATVAILCDGGNCTVADDDDTDPVSIAPIGAATAPTAGATKANAAVYIFNHHYFTNRTRLDLGNVDFGGPIPTELGSMTALKYLDLDRKSLTGTIPTELGLMTAMAENLGIAKNTLTGTIPTQLGLLSTLNGLYLYENSLSGLIPTELGLLQTLQFLWLNYNQLTGSIPTELGLMTALLQLNLFGWNTLDGVIPTELGLLKALSQLNLFDNTLDGVIPTELGLLTAVTELGLSSNDITGSIPTELALMTALTSLMLSSNNLTGPIPTELGLLTELLHLNFDDNRLTGTIPTELGLLCSSSSQCTDGCCSSQYSGNGKLKCTPLNGGYDPNMCVAGGSGLWGDWELCLSSAQCSNGCCSSKYSDDGQTKCTPLCGGYDSNICVAEDSGLCGDWELCSAGAQCANGCCSSQYSDDGQLKCTPLEGGYDSNICA